MTEPNPQPDIFVRYSKELLKAKMRVRISGVQNQVWEAIMFLTYGRNPSVSFARIQISDITKLTGLSKIAVSKAKSDLISMDMVVTKFGNQNSGVTKFGNDYLQLTGIQKHYSKWKPLPKKQKRLPNLVTKVTKFGNNEKIVPFIAFKEENKSTPPPPPQPKRKPKSYAPPSGADLKKDYPWVDPESWDNWVKFRKEIKKPLTKTTVKLQIKFLEKNKDEHKNIIGASIRAGWQGLFELKKNNANGRMNQSVANQQTTMRGADDVDDLFN